MGTTQPSYGENAKGGESRFDQRTERFHVHGRHCTGTGLTARAWAPKRQLHAGSAIGTDKHVAQSRSIPAPLVIVAILPAAAAAASASGLPQPAADNALSGVSCVSAAGRQVGPGELKFRRGSSVRCVGAVHRIVGLRISQPTRDSRLRASPDERGNALLADSGEITND
jgi:hypothetical protein